MSSDPLSLVNYLIEKSLPESEKAQFLAIQVGDGKTAVEFLKDYDILQKFSSVTLAEQDPTYLTDIMASIKDLNDPKIDVKLFSLMKYALGEDRFHLVYVDSMPAVPSQLSQAMYDLTSIAKIVVINTGGVQATAANLIFVASEHFRNVVLVNDLLVLS